METARWPRGTLLATAAILVVILVLLGIERGEALWSTSDGVYAITARELLHGGDLYRQIAAAQPPLFYLVGAGLLGIDDTLTMLRAGLELAVFATALLTGTAVLRLTGSTRWAVAACLLTPFTPIALHENALFTPETLGAPMLLGLAILAAENRALPLAGALAAACVGVKLSFLLPVLAVALVAPRRWAILGWTAACGAVLAVAGSAVWGGVLWGNIVTAQRQTGTTPFPDLAGYLAQAAWNELPLVVIAIAGLVLGARSRAPLLLRTLAAAGIGGLALVISDVKLGSYVNVVQVAEAPLLAVALAGLAWMRGNPGARRLPAAAVALAAVLGIAQSTSALIAPADPWPYTRPFAASGPRRLLSSSAVRAAARAAQHCPARAAYPGPPFVAFVADRRVPGGQPDHFILHSAYHRGRAAAVLRDGEVCPR